jgi:hypothetical protein
MTITELELRSHDGQFMIMISESLLLPDPNSAPISDLPTNRRANRLVIRESSIFFPSSRQSPL